MIFFFSDPDDDQAPHAWKIILSILAIVTVVLIGATFFSLNEGWGFVDALYWSLVTTTTVG